VIAPDDPKRRILEAATRLFAARGFDGVSVQTVADAVGMRGPSLLYHYRSKDALRAAVLADLLGHWKDDLPRVLAAAQTGSDRLDSALRAMLGFFGDQPDRARLLLRELLDRPEEMRALLADHLQPWTRLLTDYIRTGQAEGRVRRDLDPEAYVLLVVTAGLGALATGDVAGALFPPDRAPSRDANVRELVRLARAALFSPRPE
jgi:AcrR family transcriptional regulator